MVKTIIFLGTQKYDFCSQSQKLTFFLCIFDVIILIPPRGKWMLLAEWGDSIYWEMQIEKHIDAFQ